MHISLGAPVAVIMGIHLQLLVRLKLAFVVVMQPSRALVRLLCMLLGLRLGKCTCWHSSLAQMEIDMCSYQCC